MHVLVDQEGKVINVKVDKSFDRNGRLGFNSAVITALQQWKYNPAIRAENPIMVWITEKFSYIQEDVPE